MRRRDFFATLRGAAAWQFIGALGDSMLAGPSVAEEAERKRRIGVLMAHPASDPEFQQYATAFRDGLRKFGWIEGRNISFEFRWGVLDDPEVRSRSAKELVALRPDLILTQNTPPTASTLQQTRSIPNHICYRGRSHWQLVRRELVATWRQCHRLYNYGANDCRQMGAVAQRNRAPRHPCSPFV